MNRLTTLSTTQIEASYPGLLNVLGLREDAKDRFFVLDGTIDVFYIDRSPSSEVTALSIPVIDDVPYVRAVIKEKVHTSTNEEFSVSERDELIELGYVTILWFKNIFQLYSVEAGARPEPGGPGLVFEGTLDNFTINGVSGTPINSESNEAYEFAFDLEDLEMTVEQLAFAMTNLTINDTAIELLHNFAMVEDPSALQVGDYASILESSSSEQTHTVIFKLSQSEFAAYYPVLITDDGSIELRVITETGSL